MRALRAVAVPTMVAALVMAGCADDDPEPATPTASSPGSAEPSDPSGSAEPTPTTPSSDPEVEPASGLRLEHDVAALHAPEGWRKGTSFASAQLTAKGTAPGEGLSFIDLRALAPGATLDEQAASALVGYRSDGVRRLPDVTLDGQPAYHIGGWLKSIPGVRYDYVGTLRGERAVGITIQQRRDGAWRRTPGLVESVLASFEWLD